MDAMAQSRIGVAVIAHDVKKEEMMGFVGRHLPFLSACRVVATQATARLLRQRFGLAAESTRAGPQGGDVQIGARLVAGEIDAVFFLRDVLSPQPHEADILALLRLCDVCNVPYATNLATAELLARTLSGRAALAEESAAVALSAG